MSHGMANKNFSVDVTVSMAFHKAVFLNQIYPWLFTRNERFQAGTFWRKI